MDDGIPSPPRPPPPPPSPSPPPSAEALAEDAKEAKEHLTPEMLITKAEARLERIEIESRKNIFGRITSHLEHSEIDWSVTTDQFDHGKCLVKDIEYKPTGGLSHRKQHFRLKRHTDWDEKKKLEKEAQSAIEAEIMAVDETSPPTPPPNTINGRLIWHSRQMESKLRRNHHK
ncbi:unnamed protein product [Clonostachys byssicola]|uniref:Uncharacterized protein n=1 Tax=Clonostachys byssicola TaxID=160290 RepID=A0A9N9V1J9_9HYPO|nr:unnamed protein product [Clonostachys byssicola]